MGFWHWKLPVHLQNIVHVRVSFLHVQCAVEHPDLQPQLMRLSTSSGAGFCFHKPKRCTSVGPHSAQPHANGLRSGVFGPVAALHSATWKWARMQWASKLAIVGGREDSLGVI